MIEYGPKIMIVDDEEPMLEWLSIFLEQNGYQVQCYVDGKEAIKAGKKSSPDILVVDIRMPGMSGLEVFSRMKENTTDLVGIFMTAYSSIETAVNAIRQGASDYLIKPFQADQLLVAIEKALDSRKLERENRTLRQKIRKQYDFSRIIGKSKPIMHLLAQIRTVAGQKSTVLISGESGTGKELVARAIHQNSPCSNGPFLGINCGSLSRNLLESELFGHRKGSFTGAHKDKQGLLVAASGGTFFMDEIAELDMELQSKLLRTLQERQVRPVGATSSIGFDTRLIAATNRNLKQMMDDHKFRSDLYYRLNVIPIDVPALRDRPEDIPALVMHFIESNTHISDRTFSEDALEALKEYSWPGNVRELENLVERLCVMTGKDVITRNDIPGFIVPSLRTETEISIDSETDEGIAAVEPLTPTLREIEKAWILYILQHRAGGQKRLAARLLGINESTLHRKLDKYISEEN